MAVLAGGRFRGSGIVSSRELLACISALLRRQGGQVDELALGNTVLDLGACTLVCGERGVGLSAREFEVMRFLLQAKENISPKEAIRAKVWGYDPNAVENHVEVYVGFLRKKLASIGSNLRIEAVRRLGYRIEVDGREARRKRGVIAVMTAQTHAGQNNGGFSRHEKNLPCPGGQERFFALC